MANNWSRVVLTLWMILAVIIIQSYTASLASMLTINRLKPTVVDVNQLLRNGDFVGYQRGSYVKDLLIGQLKFQKDKVKPYSSAEEYHDALSKGSKKGGVDAIFDAIPYMKLFLSKHCSKYIIVGPTYKSEGFGFVSISSF